jgi:hypothetical protein
MGIPKLNQAYRDLCNDEGSSRTKAAGAVDMKVFKSLVGRVTLQLTNFVASGRLLILSLLIKIR